MFFLRYNMKDTGIKSLVIREIVELAQQCNLEQVILFGSRARGDFKPRSDIDLAIRGGDYIRFSLEIDERTSTLLFFDVVCLDRVVQKELRESIEQEGVCIYEKI